VRRPVHSRRGRRLPPLGPRARRAPAFFSGSPAAGAASDDVAAAAAPPSAGAASAADAADASSSSASASSASSGVPFRSAFSFLYSAQSLGRKSLYSGGTPVTGSYATTSGSGTGAASGSPASLSLIPSL